MSVENFLLFSFLLTITIPTFAKDVLSTRDALDELRAQSIESFVKKSDSSLQSACEQEGYACGTCEENLQGELNSILDGITNEDLSGATHWAELINTLPDSASNLSFVTPRPTMDSVLSDITDLMRRNTPGGNLNFVVIGESESLQQTSFSDNRMNPRIMLKSPNSELMVTFSTDPNLPGYNSIEIMRWNGREGKYEFQELNFGDQGEPPHIDLSGRKCIACHKSPSMRPNWDTYRAWAGVVPSRDDMLEMEFSDGELDPTKPMQPDGRAYLSFLDQVASARTGASTDSRSQRLALLDIPFDSDLQMQSYLEDFRTSNDNRDPTDSEKVDLIKRRVIERGFYRIRHHPDLTTEREGELAANFDSKTAEAAGPSQFAFDQMLSQNMCRVGATTLEENEDFEKFKYALVGALRCGGSSGFENLSEFLPPSFLRRAQQHFANSNGSTLTETPSDLRMSLADRSPEELHRVIKTDTESSHGRANDFKFDRHGRFLSGFLSEVEGNTDHNEVVMATNRFSRIILTPEQSEEDVYFHAIDDPGGVSGVEENSTEKIAALRFLLEPFDVNVEHWSLVNGRDTAYNSYSFSDQFQQFETQRLFGEVYAEVRADLAEVAISESEEETPPTPEDAFRSVRKNDVCQEIKRRSIAALDSLDPVIAPQRTQEIQLEQYCSEQLSPSADQNVGDLQDAMTDITLNAYRNDMRGMLNACITCHGDHVADNSSVPRFGGLQSFVEDGDQEEFIDLLNSMKGNTRYLEIFEDKLGLHGATTLGSEMPPFEFQDNNEFAEKFAIEGSEDVQNIRRRYLAEFLGVLASAPIENNEASVTCATIDSDQPESNPMDAFDDLLQDPGSIQE